LAYRRATLAGGTDVMVGCLIMLFVPNSEHIPLKKCLLEPTPKSKK